MTQLSFAKTLVGIAGVLGGLSLLPACDDGGGAGDDASATGTGGAVGTGGAASSGGQPGSGGSSGTGGRAGTGGSSSSGGAPGSGGSSSAGGASASGGTSSTGGKAGTGGASSGGGAAGSGGTTGGAAGTGGGPGTGGTSAPRDGGGDVVSGPEAGTGGSDGGGTPSVRLQGRFDLADATRPSFSWSGSAMIARFQGTGATLRIDGSAGFFTVVVDGTVAAQVLKTTSGTTTYALASGLAAGTHDVVVWRRTEGNQGENRFLGIDVTGGQLLAPPAAPDRRIEIYGDSITAGYGLDGKGPGCPWSADTENHYLTYGALAARELGADLHTVAWSGIGMYRNYNEVGPSTENMPAVYARTLASKSDSKWDFATWRPHAVVINLGTNDASTKGDPGTPYRTNYLDFVRTLRQKYPDTFFVLTIGPMLDGDNLKAIRTHLQAVVSTRASEGDSKMSYLEFPVQSLADGMGCDSHPSATTNAKMATLLVSELKTRLAW